MTPLADPCSEGVRIVDEAARRGLIVRLIGGTAVAACCPSARRPPLARPVKDIDLVARRRDRGRLGELLADLGYRSHGEFNVLQGRDRLLFWDDANDRQLDVLLERFQMCHTLDLGDRLERAELTIPAADLLLTKLQVRETNEHDLKDAVALLLDADVDFDRIARVLANDWGWWRTATEVLGRVQAYAAVLPQDERARIAERTVALRERIEQEPKSLRWKARARVGDRVRWYEEPEEEYA